MAHGRRWLIGAVIVVAMAVALSLIAAGGQPTLAEDGIIYVDIEAPGPTHDGASWETAFTELQPALDAAIAEDEIWVAAGVYTPTWKFDPEDERSATFQMVNGVAIYGGFAGTETEQEQRDWTANPTILSGDLNGDDGPDFENTDDNSYHVFYHPSGTALNTSAILDGFAITGGNANSETGTSSTGGGMYNSSSSPTLANCTFSHNSATGSGGGIHNYSSSPMLTGCVFADNWAGWGGGMHNGWYSLPSLSNCTFEGNSARYGGAIYNSDGNSPSLDNCSFSGNSALNHGGAIYNSHSTPSLRDCTFTGNSAGWGGGLYNNAASPLMTNCTLSGNSATEGGGGLYSYAWSPYLTNCTLTGNSAGTEGGGMYNDGSSPTLTGCSFSGNSAGGSGGGMHNTGDADPTLTNCTFQRNTAGTEGGGMHNDGSSPTLTGCTFSENTADAGGGIYNGECLPELLNCTFAGNSANSGGGMHNDGSSPVLVNCTFTGNAAVGNGGGLRNTRLSSPTLTNCTFHGNRATNGGAIHNYENSYPTLTNCILWGDSKPEIDNLNSSTANVAFSDVEGGYLYPGTGNINEDPLFMDPDNGDFHLGPGSPCIDAGTEAAPLLPDGDFEGDPRSMDGDRDGTATVDMGVDEALWHPFYLPLVRRGY